MVTRWWLASASFPVVAGVLCALAIMFNICAVSQGWREIIDADGSASIITQPAWAVALKAMSLAFAVVAYLVLLLTMISKHDPVKGFIVTVLCWCTSAVTLLTVIGVIAGEHTTVNAQQTLRYTQNYFYGTFAAGLYILIAVLLAIYTCSVRSVHLTHGERRTVECTSIILRVAAFSVFLLAGAAVYASIEGWTFMDALYWADYTLLTIGIGNIAPQTHLGRSLLFPYVSAGILNTGLVITSITSFTENIRELSIRFKIDEVHSGIQGRRPLDEYSSNGHSDREKQGQQTPAESRYPIKADLMKLQGIKRDFYRRHRWTTLILSGIALFFLWLVSAAVFRRSERSQKWTYFQALYFTYTSLTTIGYGDLYPTSNLGKAFFVFWSLLAVPVLTNLVAAMGQLGFEKLTYLLRYLWRLKASSLGRMNPDAHSEEARSKSVPGLDLFIDSNSHAPNLIKAGQSSNNVPGSSAYEKHEGGASLVQAAHRSLLLGVEIGKLISTLQGSTTTQLDLESEWDMILPLLHPENDGCGLLEPTSLTTLYSHRGTVLEFLDSDRPATDMNKEILWMLNFLTEKVCSNLREALQREQSERSDTLS
ncbi:potassium channel family protein [Aspergillus novofumigatus IBT 16806]|uniref:TOK2 potassium channel n=1 Tax=Aspergillus novofumigatus (strain IBT 16806) TaxID=1392255 RepID=A0A2I1BXH6_ASPN1|nr:TOK2 potassium channel [Aspergillus novofumigatus IBT 16806]PKX90093.1 TOK2 potassium channel [Aspergillus novofumigatus IBT 16806]